MSKYNDTQNEERKKHTTQDEAGEKNTSKRMHTSFEFQPINIYIFVDNLLKMPSFIRVNRLDYWHWNQLTMFDDIDTYLSIIDERYMPHVIYTHGTNADRTEPRWSLKVFLHIGNEQC